MIPKNVILLISLFFFLACQMSDSSSPATASDQTSFSESNKIINEAIKETFNPKDHPLIFRRTTLIVRDIEKSLALYRDAMGMEVIYDNIIKRPHPTEDREQDLKLVFLKAVHDYYGIIGLLEYDHGNPSKKPKPIQRNGFTEQNVVLLFNTTEFEERYPKILNSPGVEVFSEPTIREYPSYDGTDIIRVQVSVLYDPDGFLVEFNQLLSEVK